MTNLQSIIEKAWENRALLQEDLTINAIREVIGLLDNGTLRVAEPTANGNALFFNTGVPITTYNPNYTGATLGLYFNTGTTLGTSYLTQFQGLDATGGTMTISQGINTVIYSGASNRYNIAPNGYLILEIVSPAQMISPAPSPFVSGTTINVVTS